MSIPAQARQLLNFIGSIEAPQGYETIYGNNQKKLKKPITRMTIDQVIANQRNWTKAYGSSAAGRYQFMRATLQGLKKEGKAQGGELFDAACQDRLGFDLLVRRGYNQFMAGKISKVEFGKRLAQEWASFPVLRRVQGAHRMVERGQSYYAGDGVNKALVSPIRVEAALAALKGTEPKPRPEARPEPDGRPDPVPGPEIDDAEAVEPKRKLRWSKRLWTWLTVFFSGGALPSLREAGLLELDWTFWAILAGLVVVMSLIGIVTMPEVRRGLGRAIGGLLP